MWNNDNFYFFLNRDFDCRSKVCKNIKLTNNNVATTNWSNYSVFSSDQNTEWSRGRFRRCCLSQKHRTQNERVRNAFFFLSNRREFSTPSRAALDFPACLSAPRRPRFFRLYGSVYNIHGNWRAHKTSRIGFRLRPTRAASGRCLSVFYLFLSSSFTMFM